MSPSLTSTGYSEGSSITRTSAGSRSKVVIVRSRIWCTDATVGDRLQAKECPSAPLDQHDEFTVASSAIERTDTPTLRSTASPGDIVCVTGTLGRTGAALRLFEQGEHKRANTLFQFEPRVSAGRALVPYVSAMMDSSDGLARPLHQLAEASDCGFVIEWDRVPLDETVSELATTGEEERKFGLYTGEDFELVFTIPRDRIV